MSRDHWADSNVRPYHFAAIPNLKLGEGKEAKILTQYAKSQRFFGLLLRQLAFPPILARKDQKNWRLGGFALSSLVSDLELLIILYPP
jgi:hypothetical protein